MGFWVSGDDGVGARGVFGYYGVMKLSEEQREQLREIGIKHALVLILLHGSYATGKNRSDSDMDIAYLPGKPLGYKEQLSIHSELAEVFGDGRGRELDVKSLAKADPLFRYEVARESKLLFGERMAYDEFRADAFVRYQDARSLLRLERLLSRRQLTSLKSSL